MNIRKNIYSLSDAQLEDFQEALNEAKADGSYDDFIVRHHHSMMTPTPFGGEAPNANIRNVAHRGPAFAPWHRYFCRELELVLQAKRPNVTLPYWEWTVDSANPAGAALWNTDPNLGRIYVGGDGTGPNDTVTTGPFANWTALIESGGAVVPRPYVGIERTLGVDVFGNPSFPNAAQVTDAISNLPVFDTSPWRTTSTGSFRNRLEGWLSTGPGESGVHLHNSVHVFVGGDMGPGTSPNDPVFFLHHCNIDRIWALWQHANPGSGYLPVNNGPVGHNLTDQMQFLTSANPTPEGSLDYRRTLGFIYDTDPPLVELPDATVNFNDVPELETTWRAAVFAVRAGSTIHLEVVAGSGPNPPYSLTALGGSVTHNPPVDNAPFDEVRVWFAFTGEASPGPAPNGSVQIRCVETNEIFDVTLTANTVARPTTGVVFCLDKSGSMSAPAGTGPTRMEVLHEAASRCVELTRDGSGAGFVSFDHDAYPGLPLQAFSGASTHRADVVSAINALAPGGATSIGDGVVLARQTLTAGAAGFDGHALVVLTDGLENQPQWLDNVAPSIDQRTFAIGLGTAQQVSTGSLTKLANNTDGFLLLTGALAPDTDSYFLLSKYFQQILVTATNENIVTDPTGYVAPGQEIRIPFALTDTDIDATTVLMVDVPAVDLVLETPAGDRLDESNLSGLGAQVERGTRMTFCRMGLPLPIGTGSHGGMWHIVVGVDRARLEREISKLKSRAADGDEQAKAALERIQAHGLRYSASVSSWSNLRLSARLGQTSLEPGATFRLDAALWEFGLPVAGRARVRAEIIRPDGVVTTVSLAEQSPGAFATELPGTQAGVWRFKVKATGHTYRGLPFSREQLLGAALILGGDRPPEHPEGEADLICLIRCLIEDEGIRRILEERGIDGKKVAECVRRCSRGERGERELDMLG